MLCFYCTQTHIKLQYEFSGEFLKTIFARLPPGAARTPSLRLWREVLSGIEATCLTFGRPGS